MPSLRRVLGSGPPDAARRLAFDLAPFSKIGEGCKGVAGRSRSPHPRKYLLRIILYVVLIDSAFRPRAAHFVDIDTQFGRQAANRGWGGSQVRGGPSWL